MQMCHTSFFCSVDLYVSQLSFHYQFLTTLGLIIWTFFPVGIQEKVALVFSVGKRSIHCLLSYFFICQKGKTNQLLLQPFIKAFLKHPKKPHALEKSAQQLRSPSGVKAAFLQNSLQTFFLSGHFLNLMQDFHFTV